MAYYRPRKPDSDQPTSENFNGPGFISQMWDMLRSAPAGAWQGFLGKNLTYEQWLRERNRRKMGYPPGVYPGRGPLGWLKRLLR